MKQAGNNFPRKEGVVISIIKIPFYHSIIDGGFSQNVLKRSFSFLDFTLPYMFLVLGYKQLILYEDTINYFEFLRNFFFKTMCMFY